MQAYLDIPGLHMDFNPLTISFRELARNNGMMKLYSSNPFIPQSVFTLSWSGRGVSYNSEWTNYEWSYLVDRLKWYRDAAVPQGKCLRYSASTVFDYWETGDNYVSVGLTQNGKTMSINLHHLAHYVDSRGECIKEFNNSGESFTWVISHYCSHKNCGGGVDGTVHCGIEPQSVNLHRKKCWGKYLKALEDGVQFKCIGHEFYDPVDNSFVGYFLPCVFTYPEDMQ